MSHEGTLARVRVYLPTYRRSALLRRAIDSLRAQTITDWVCEVHNDDPDDRFPARLLQEIGDSRLQLVQHPHNFGATTTFNLFYRPVAEPYFTLLEDDNSWEADFLHGMLATLAAYPQAVLAWCNQRIVYEQADGSLQPSEEFAHPLEASDTPARAIAWGQWRQIGGGLHANGAMLMRSIPGRSYTTPAVTFDCMEAFRERCIPHPIIFQPRAMATFTVTCQSARGGDLRGWSASQAAMAASFFKHAKWSEEQLEQICTSFRQQRPPMTSTLIHAALICREARPLLRHLRLADWWRFVKSALRHPLTTWHALRVRTLHPDWWEFLDRSSAERFREAAESGN